MFWPEASTRGVPGADVAADLSYTWAGVVVPGVAGEREGRADEDRTDRERCEAVAHVVDSRSRAVRIYGGTRSVRQILRYCTSYLRC